MTTTANSTVRYKGPKTLNSWSIGNFRLIQQIRAISVLNQNYSSFSQITWGQRQPSLNLGV